MVVRYVFFIGKHSFDDGVGRDSAFVLNTKLCGHQKTSTCSRAENIDMVTDAAATAAITTAYDMSFVVRCDASRCANAKR